MVQLIFYADFKTSLRSSFSRWKSWKNSFLSLENGQNHPKFKDVFFREVGSGEKNCGEQIRDPQGLKFIEIFLDFCSPGGLFQVYVPASVIDWLLNLSQL